jgi:NADH:ubiquinone oxidoreductase subunit B-like Fe-S oxidoreductase
MELVTEQERQVQGADSNVPVPDYMYGCKTSAKTLLQREED